MEKTRQEIDKLYNQNLVGIGLVEHTYAALYLSAFTSFEGFLEDLFIGLLIENKGFFQPKVKARVVVKSYAVARELILAQGNGNYVNWLPFNNTKELAQLFFVGGRPFTSLPDNYLELLQKSQYIRNVFAHQSEFSMGKFTKHVIGSQKFSPREKKPFGYLRAFHTQTTPTKYEFHIGSLSQLARLLTS